VSCVSIRSRQLSQLVLVVGLASVPLAARGDFHVKMNAGTCELTQPPVIQSGSGTDFQKTLSSSGTCPGGQMNIPPPFDTSYTATAIVSDTQSSLDLTVEDLLGSYAAIDASLGFTGTFTPPPGTNPSTVTVGLATPYDLTMSWPSGQFPPAVVTALITLSTDSSALTAMTQLNAVDQNGEQTGLAQTPDITVRCCTLRFTIEDAIVAEDGGSVHLVDPPQLILTPDEIAAGWTATVSPGPVLAPDPEPLSQSAAALAGLALVLLWARRRPGPRVAGAAEGSLRRPVPQSRGLETDHDPEE
jgi:hypothetical protein